MSNMLEDGMTSMMGTLLANAGSDMSYQRDTSTANDITMHKRPQTPVMVANGDGSQLVEMLMTDFLIDPANLPFGEPLRNDLITDTTSGEVYSVQSGPNDKCYRQMADSLMRIHTKRIR